MGFLVVVAAWVPMLVVFNTPTPIGTATHRVRRTATPAHCSATCPGDFDSDGTVTISELVSAVNGAIHGCPIVLPTVHIDDSSQH